MTGGLLGANLSSWANHKGVKGEGKKRKKGISGTPLIKVFTVEVGRGVNALSIGSTEFHL